MMSIVLIICITVLIAGLLFMLQSGIQLELIVFVGVVTIETIALILTLARRKASPDTDQATVLYLTMQPLLRALKKVEPPI